MAITYIGQANNASTAANRIIVTKPANVAANSLMIAHIFIEDTTDRIAAANGVPADWNLIANNTVGTRAIRQYLYYKVANGSEPANYTWLMNANDEIIGMIAAFDGANTAGPIGNWAMSTGTAANATHTAPAITIGANNHWGVQVSGTAFGTLYTAPANWDERTDRQTGANNAGRITAALFTRELGAGSTGNIASTSANSDYFIASLVEIKLPVANNYPLECDPGAYTSVGEAQGTLMARIIEAGGSAYIMAGEDLSLSVPGEYIGFVLTR